jgi:hypothetical protein
MQLWHGFERVRKCFCKKVEKDALRPREERGNGERGGEVAGKSSVRLARQ